ncbi:hypothetical protein ILUMI_07870 [Ignelater luminosus]|uniref:Deoxynucleotidyltransferase terminal-interacting protein 1 n=1 Tax=Ignelater luminosus TaxID=2038154 RepID=A0A8K0D312_IGNLU|nr:hypothetical protein ILUMI_07870 [Ignelater luminosus]
MIPPLAPGQTDEQHNMVGWKNTFNMRQVTLMNLAASHLGARNCNTSNYMSAGCITSPAKSLDILRKNLQSAINKDIDNVIRKYLEKFFQPAVNNIRMNLGKNSVNDDLIKSVCQQMLEEAKIMYKISASSRDSSPCDYSDSEAGSFADGRIERMSPVHYKRKESDTDSEPGYIINRKRHKPKSFKSTENLSHKLPEKREGPKWDPDRIHQNTLFIMGARANKVLGFGQTRGRLYVRHPEMLRYSGDPEDKEWLASRNLMPPSGGRAYLMLLEDIQELALNDDYRNSPNLQLNELQGFEAPPFMIHKIKAFLEHVRTDKKQPPPASDLFDFQRSQSITPLSGAVDSAPSTPSDTLQTLESQSLSTSSKHSDINSLINIPETSPGSNNSFMSGPFAPSPLRTSNSLSPNVLVGITVDSSNNNGSVLNLVENVQNEKILANLLSTHGSTDNSQEL